MRSTTPSPSLRAKRSNPSFRLPRHGLLRRFAPRNDELRSRRFTPASPSSPPPPHSLSPSPAAAPLRRHAEPRHKIAKTTPCKVERGRLAAPVLLRPGHEKK